MSPNETVAVAVIGAGCISKYHVDGLRAAGGSRITALVGRTRECTEAWARQLGITRTETDHHAVLDDPAVDVVVVATPGASYAPIAIDAMAADKSVLLQKPMALNSEECRAILSLRARTGAGLTVSFMHRYYSEVFWLKAQLAAAQPRAWQLNPGLWMPRSSALAINAARLPSSSLSYAPPARPGTSSGPRCWQARPGRG